MSEKIIYDSYGRKIGSVEKIESGFFNTEKIVRRDNEGKIVETTFKENDSFGNTHIKHQDSEGKSTGETVRTTDYLGRTVYERRDSDGKKVSTSRRKEDGVGNSYKETKDSSGNVSETTSDSNSGFCYLTTACVNYARLPDNCLELRTLRNFRDFVLMKDSKGKKAINEYYKIAPVLVENINSLDNFGEIWNSVHQEIKTASKLILEGKFNEAFDHYKKITSGLIKDFF